MDWGPHIFSMLMYLLNDYKFEYLSKKVFFNKKNNKKINIFLKIKFNKLIIKILFGNNLLQKKTYFALINDNLKYEYFDKYMVYSNLTNKVKKNFQNKEPLNNSIDEFKNLCLGNISNQDSNLDLVTYKISELRNMLLK